MIRFSYFLITIGLMLGMAACTQPEPIPRPSGYPRIPLPQHSYEQFSSENCPFTFELPAIAELEKTKQDSCWMDFYFPDLNCRWHITYRDVKASGRPWASHYEDYRKLVYKHIQKVSQIEERAIDLENGAGTLFELYGNVGVPAQLLFGNPDNLVMVSFYFDQAVKNDSLAPVIDYMKTDLLHMAETMQWQ